MLKSPNVAMLGPGLGRHVSPKSLHFDLNRPPSVLYGVKYIDPVSLVRLSAGTLYLGMAASASHLDLSCPPYVLYGVKYIDPLSVLPFSGSVLEGGWGLWLCTVAQIELTGQEAIQPCG